MFANPVTLILHGLYRTLQYFLLCSSVALGHVVENTVQVNA